MDRRSFLAAAAVAPFALRSPAVWARGAGGTPIALVTADLESRIVAVDLSTGRVARVLPTLPGPRSVETVGVDAVVAHAERGALTLVDGPNLRVRAVVSGFGEPRYAAAGPDGAVAYVTDSAREELVTVLVPSGRIVHRLALEGPARHVAFDRRRRRLWVALGTRAARLAVVDASDPLRPRLLRTVRPPFLAHDVGVTPRGGSVWVTSGDRGALAVYDARTFRLRRRLFAHAPPQHVTFAGELAFVTSGDAGTLRIHRLADGRLVRTVPIPRGSYNVQEGWGVVLSPSLSQGTLTVVGGRGETIRRVRVARSSHDACFVAAA